LHVSFKKAFNDHAGPMRATGNNRWGRRLNNKPPKEKNMLNQNDLALIEILNDCCNVCEMCATACLREENVKMLSKCIELDRDCADICRTAAALLRRDSKIAHQYLLLCEEICRMCAEECQKHTSMRHCMECAEECLRCAEACHELHEPIMQK